MSIASDKADTPLRLSGVIVKPVSNTCNLACSYCYAAAGSPTPTKAMSITTAHRLIDQVMEHATSQRIEFIWHGGEPLLRGLDFYKEVIEYQRRYSGYGIAISNAIQTNLMLIDEPWLEFCAQNKLQLSTSIDGPQWIHDKERHTRSGSGSHADVIAGINRAQQHGVQVNTLTVISSSSVDYPIEIYSHLHELGVRNCGFLPCFCLGSKGNVEAPTVSASQYGQFLCTVFDEYFKSSTLPRVREFEQIICGMFDEFVSVCSFNGSCHRFICVDHNGDVYSCDTSPLSAEYRFGNLNDSPLSDVLSGNLRLRSIQRTGDLPPCCQACDYFHFCNGGCPNQRPDGKYYFCVSRKRLFRHIEERLDWLADIVDARERQGVEQSGAGRDDAIGPHPSPPTLNI
jgi:uncharacterized protein